MRYALYNAAEDINIGVMQPKDLNKIHLNTTIANALVLAR